MLIQSVSPVNYAGNQSFTANSKYLESLVSKSFEKIATAKKHNMDTFMGSTVHGENIVIQETVLGKVAKLFISYPDRTVGKGAKPFEIFNLKREAGKIASVTDENGEKTSSRKLFKADQILDNLI